MAQIPPRNFYLGPPVILIWDDATLKSTLNFSQYDNLDTKDTSSNHWWRKHEGAPPTEVEGGKRYPHVDGYYLNGKVVYNLYPPESTIENRNVNIAPQMTEYEMWLIDNAQLEGWDILFYPHNDLPGIGNSNDAKYRMIVKTNSFRRRGHAQNRVKATFECESAVPWVARDRAFFGRYL